MKLDLGAGGRPREGFTGVDVVELAGGIAFDLVSGHRWPWQSDSIEELASSHFIEHIPLENIDAVRAEPDRNIRRFKQDALFFFFDEAFRIIKPGGLFHLAWPALKSSDAFRDPTHRRFIPLEMLHYLSLEGRRSMGLEHYEARCNWLTVEGSTQYHLAAPRDRPSPEGMIAHEHLWDVAKCVSVTLRAVK